MRTNNNIFRGLAGFCRLLSIGCVEGLDWQIHYGMVVGKTKTLLKNHNTTFIGRPAFFYQIHMCRVL